MINSFVAVITIALSFTFANAQIGEKAKSASQAINPSTTQSRETESANAANNEEEPPKISIWLHLVGGWRTQVDEATQAADGVWYRRGNVTTFIDATRVERIERSSDPRLASLSETFDGTRRWSIADSGKVKNFFQSKFNRPLPLSAYGQSELHNRWGLDHRQSMDVGLHPDSVEGKALINFLISEGIPFLAFRTSVPGVATGPHIHIGHGSSRLRPRR